MEQQTHVAQQSQQQKLRISGSQYPLPSQIRNDSHHLQKASSSYPECSTGYLKGYQEQTGQNNIENAFHGYTYDNCMTSSDPYDFCSAPESQHLLLKDTGHFCSNSARCTPPLVGNIDSGESPINVCLNIQVNASKTGKWGSGGPQLEIMNNNSFLNLPLSVNIMTSAAAAELLSAPSVQSSSFGSNGKEETMATYYPDSSIQGDTMQTLYLMNPGIPGYTDSMVSGNMVLLNNTTGGMLATHNYIGNGQPQDLIGISIPMVSPSHHSSLGAAENPSAKQQRVSSSILTTGLAAHAYSSWQAGGTELTFLQTTDATSTNQSLCAQLNGSVKVANPSVADVSQLGMRHPSMSSIEEQHSEILNKELCLQLDQPPTATGQSQELSLRLFPQHPHTVKSHSFQNIPTELDMNCTGIAQATSEENTYRVDESNGDGMVGPGFSNYIHNPGTGKGMLSCSTEVARSTNVVRGSKYFKAAQNFLDEIANLGKFSKCDSSKNHKSQTLFGARTDKENNFTETGEKDGAANSRTGNTTAAEKGNNPHNPEVTPAERQELQIKKAKLVAMLDEVDKKYRQYYHQMQIVVSMFESVTEVGAAKTYTSLALRTISKQFRCLRDAISGQICLASKSLGEEEVTGSLKGETSRLRFVDQHLRQQRVLQQLGMIQQNAWRPQRGLPERAVSVLRAWLFEHFLHPYPKDADKVVLARQAGLTRSQVSNWFINARVRLWKPMIEEMYIEEMKESMAKNNGENKEDAKLDGGPVNSHNIQKQKHRKSMHLENGIKDGICQDQNTSLSGSLKSEHSCESMYDKIRTFSMEEASDKEDLHDVQDEGATRGQIKKARNRIEDQNYQFSSHMSTEADFKLKQSHREDIYDKFNEGRNNTMGYSLVQNDGVLAEDNGSSVSYQFGCLNRYEQDSFLTRFSGNGGVSLTLGLQQSECLSFSGTQQSCIASQGGSNELVRASDGNCNISKTSAAHSANTYDSIGLQNRKSFSTHLMQTS